VRTILIADPNTGFASFIAEALRGLGAYSVSIAASGPEAKQICTESQPDLAIVDVDLPDCQPAALVGELRGLRPGLPIIYIPYTREDVPADLTVEGVLTKPFFLPDLQPLLRAILGPDATLPTPAPGAASPGARPAPTAPAKPVKLKLTPESIRQAAERVQALSHAVRDESALLSRGREVLCAAPAGGPAAALVEVVATARKNAGNSEVIRFEGDDESARFMLYSLGIGGELALSVALRVRLPLLTVRKLVRDAAAEIAALVTE
jgi:CheY-like chemotaxis protein